jgi:nitrogen fixation protein FixH
MTTLARGRWIPWTYAGGMLLVVVVNAILITAAFRSFPGLVVQRPYDRGIAYNEELRRQQVQSTLGWTIVPSYAAGRLTVRISSSDGTPVDALDVAVTLSRPLEPMPALVMPLSPVAEAYAGDVELRRGQWEIRIQASGRAGTYHGVYRMVAP